ncbi:unnamed protein product [Didymodactylos carnosus]|uniref:Uncharacterized protein n=1 Tax=Didymodactylos carnosus TaxID=1234261 RepID=A0A815GB71_9BILA|nr:unnamed protein product [Didymodactylos carnosus]CAF1352800.1 unnamed protein product [Didymodactylos carnosus]CAF4163192.1 unnamed protein product [Didymodactylos carnosus]CAF4193811.1 unnamed protein product [Didymodactylos carnosus]
MRGRRCIQFICRQINVRQYINIQSITTNKAVLRLLIEYRFDRTLIDHVLYPLWLSKPHQDVRLCCVSILIQFIKTNFENEHLWLMLEEAASQDKYIKISDELFPGGNLRKLLQLHSDEQLRTFVERIQMKSLDHPTLIIRKQAWRRIDTEYCPQLELISKAVDLCLRFDLSGRTLAIYAFQRLLDCCKRNLSCMTNILQIFKELTTSESYKLIDRQQNALNDQQDLPVYNRINSLINLLAAVIKRYRHDEQIVHQLKEWAANTLIYNKTLATSIGILLLNSMTGSQDELVDMIKFLKVHLSNEFYLFHVLRELSLYVEQAPFINEINLEQKLTICYDLIKSDDLYYIMLIFGYFKSNILSQESIDKEKCRELLRLVRTHDNLVLNEMAMQCQCTWKAEDNDDRSTSDMIEIDSSAGELLS